MGKTSVVRAFLAGLDTGVRVLEGACDDLLTPRPFGPVHDVSRSARPASGPRPGRGRGAVDLHRAARRAHRRAAGLIDGSAATVLVVEDVHWADDASLDALAFVARRIEGLRALLVLTYRDDEVPVVSLLQRVLGGLRAPVAVRVALGPLSARAVTQLAGEPGAGLRVLRIHRRQPVLRHRAARRRAGGAARLGEPGRAGPGGAAAGAHPCAAESACRGAGAGRDRAAGRRVPGLAGGRRGGRGTRRGDRARWGGGVSTRAGPPGGGGGDAPVARTAAARPRAVRATRPRCRSGAAGSSRRTGRRRRHPPRGRPTGGPRRSRRRRPPGGRRTLRPSAEARRSVSGGRAGRPARGVHRRGVDDLPDRRRHAGGRAGARAPGGAGRPFGGGAEPALDEHAGLVERPASGNGTPADARRWRCSRCSHRARTSRWPTATWPCASGSTAGSARRPNAPSPTRSPWPPRSTTRPCSITCTCGSAWCTRRCSPTTVPLQRSLDRARQDGYHLEAGMAYQGLAWDAVLRRDWTTARRWIGEGVEYLEPREILGPLRYLRGLQATTELAAGDWTAAEATARWVLAQQGGQGITGVHASATVARLHVRRGETEKATSACRSCGRSRRRADCCTTSRRPPPHSRSTRS